MTGASPTKQIDPVCGMTVDPEKARGGSFEHAATMYYFCSPGCRAKFAADPDGILARGATPMSHAGTQGMTLHRRASTVASAQAAPAATHADPHAHHVVPTAPPAHESTVTPVAASVVMSKAGQYTCPMHPEIINDGPGDCPICGMALEPVMVTAEPADDTELRNMTRRFWIATAFAAPLLVIAMRGMRGGMWAGQPWAELALALPVCTWAAWPFFARAVASVRHRSPNMFTLIGLGVSVACAPR
jgi:Cu+-exporting ATPase